MSLNEEKPLVDYTEENPAKRRRRTLWDSERPKSSENIISQPPVIAPVLAIPPPPTTPAPVSSLLAAANLPQNFNTSLPLPIAQNPQQLLAQSKLASLLAQSPKNIGCRIYIGSVHYDLREPDLIALFSAFGNVVSCDMSMDSATGKTKGFCFLEYDNVQSADAAMAMNGFELAGRKIKVGRPFNGVGASAFPPTSFANPLGLPMNPLQSMAAAQAPIFSPPLPPTQPPSSSASFLSSNPLAAVAAPLIISNFITIGNINSEIGVAEVQELFSLCGTIKNTKRLTARKLDPYKFYDLLIEFTEEKSALAAVTTMNGHNLAATALVVESTSLQGAIQLMVQQVEQTVLTSLLLENMITEDDMQDPGLKDEILEEAKVFGEVLKINIAKDEMNAPIVKIQYKEGIQAGKAQKAMNGRGFAGRKIKATLTKD